MDEPAPASANTPAWLLVLAGALFATALLEQFPRNPSEAELRARVPEGFLEERLPDPAHASPRELRALPGIGETRALAIARSRHAEGPFRELGELERIHGIGPATVERVRSVLEAPGVEREH
ncbi:MAG: helix-hairpin-helix domain-containing protein [Planctomycetes bacterium]|nr:helix-hairpin-helix domain-containing protein [Planctomycetota bacterium]